MMKVMTSKGSILLSIIAQEYEYRPNYQNFHQRFLDNCWANLLWKKHLWSFSSTARLQVARSVYAHGCESALGPTVS